MTLHHLIVCTTCRRAGSGMVEPCDGTVLYETVQALAARTADNAFCAVVGVECMSGCDKGCTVGLAAPGKPSYLFGGVAATAETAADALALVRQYRDRADGLLSRRTRPDSFRRGILARIPPAFQP